MIVFQPDESYGVLDPLLMTELQAGNGKRAWAAVFAAVAYVMPASS